MCRTMNDLTDRSTYISQSRNDNEYESKTYIMDRTSFIHPDNRKMRDEYIERYFTSQIDDELKSAVGVNPIADEDKVKTFDRSKLKPIHT